MTSGALLPNAEQTFLDADGNPLAAGLVYFYIPATTTPKTTWQDAAGGTPNSNPIVLNAAGRAIIYGVGQYRQVVYSAAGVLQWDQLTEFSPVSAAMQPFVESPTVADAVALLLPYFLPAGTKMVFLQSVAPVGWTQDVSLNDMVLRVIDDGTGGLTGGDWKITGITATTVVASHVLTAAQIPAHTHTTTILYGLATVTNTATQLFEPSGSAGSVGIVSDVGTGGGLGHDHGATTALLADALWRPAYANVLAATKD